MPAGQCCRRSSLDFDRVEGKGERAETLVSAVLLASKHTHTSVPRWPLMSDRISSFLSKCCSLKRTEKALRTGSDPLGPLPVMPCVFPYLVFKASSSSPSSCPTPDALLFSTRRKRKQVPSAEQCTGAKERQCKSTSTCVLSQGCSKSMPPHGSDALIPVLHGFPIHSSTSSADTHLVFLWGFS